MEPIDWTLELIVMRLKKTEKKNISFAEEYRKEIWVTSEKSLIKSSDDWKCLTTIVSQVMFKNHTKTFVIRWETTTIG